MSQKKGDGGFAVKDRRPGFAMIDNALIDDYGPTIGAYGIAAYCILVRFARADGTDAYPSYQKVAELMGTSRSTAIRAIKKLVGLGLIEKEGRKSKGESLSNIYILVHITKTQAQQEVGSVPQTLPSIPQTLPSIPQTLGSVPRTPDQDTITIHSNNTPSTIESSSDGHDDDDETRKTVKILSNALQEAGIGLNKSIVDQYIELVANYGLHAVLSGLQSAVENNKQHRFKYVATCAENAAKGTRPPFTKKGASNGTTAQPTAAATAPAPAEPSRYARLKAGQ